MTSGAAVRRSEGRPFLGRRGRGIEELALAAVLGSAVYNATATLGMAALVHPIRAGRLGWPSWWQSWLAAALLVASYGSYLALTFDDRTGREAVSRSP